MTTLVMKSPLVALVGRRVAVVRVPHSAAAPLSTAASAAKKTSASAAAASAYYSSSRLYPTKRSRVGITMAARWQHTVTMENLNPCIKTMEYAVRGPLVIRATEIEKELESVSCLT